MEKFKKKEYGLTKTFLPLLNTSDFLSVFGGKTGNIMPLDEKGLIRSFETILFPNSKLEILSQKDNVLQVQTKEYPYEGSFFIDARLVEQVKQEPLERKKTLPSSHEILKTVFSLLGQRYFWGGNCLKVPQMLTLYPPKSSPTSETLKNWTLEGFDCSGLMYYATEGITPRNTSSWVFFEKEIEIENKTPQEILALLKPLDAIIWKGHIVFVYDALHTIESRAGKGVVLSGIKERLQEILQSGLVPKNSFEPGCFVIRRWHPDFLL
jgi:hypothetical protein